MKKLLIVLVALFSFSSHAKWKFVETIKEGNPADIYMDDARIERKGDIVSYWGLINYKNPQKLSDGRFYRSAITKWSINCSNKTHAVMYLSFHEQFNQGGKTLLMTDLEKSPDYMNIPPNTYADKNAMDLCKKN